MIIRQKYSLISVLLFLALIASAGAQNNWEGTAVVGRYGEFPSGGLYVASNTFPLNSMVSVTNMQNGRAARLIVAKTIEDPGVFLLLSEAAASELGVTASDTVGVRVQPVQLPGLTSVDPNKDLPFHPDPDVNPAATLGDPNASIIRPNEPAAVATPAAPVAPIATPEDVPESAPEAETGPAPIGQPDLTVIADVTPEVEPEPEEDVVEEPVPEEPVVPQPEEPAPDTPVASTVDESDFAGDGAVVGAAPTIAGQLREESGEPEVSMPRVNPQPRPPLSVALVLPRERGITDDVPATRAPAIVESAPMPPVEGDPLAERLAAVESELADEQIASAPLEISPVGTVASPDDGDLGDETPPLPEIDLTAVFVAEAELEPPVPPNPVRVVVELPEVEDRTVPQVTAVPPRVPELGPGEIALPLVPVEDFLVDSADLRIAAAEEEATDAMLPTPESPETVVTEAETDDGTDATEEPLRPTRIPEDSIVTLEPADYRSPEPPDPEVDELEATEPVEETAAVALAEPGETGAVTPESETAPEAVTEAEAEVAVEETPVVAEPQVATGGDDEVWARENLPLITGLRSGVAYVQVAAFSNPRSAKQTVDQIGDRFPVAVVPQPGADRSVYRIYVGPLSEDEKGSALYSLRNRGFRDAFVRE